MLMMFFLLFAFKPSTDNIPERILQKIERAVKETYIVEDFKLEAINIEPALDNKTPVAVSGEHFFSLKAKNDLIGYLYLGEAPSKKNVFDYIVLFEPDWTIKKAKILIYREDYGRQVGSQRWLVQFIGLTPQSTITYGEDVDAISGATISAKSMTNAVSQVLESVNILNAEGAL